MNNQIETIEVSFEDASELLAKANEASNSESSLRGASMLVKTREGQALRLTIRRPLELGTEGEGEIPSNEIEMISDETE